jgi:GNAT superfamily N-acetyltransferase
MSYTIRLASFPDAPALADLLREVGWFDAINNNSLSDAATHIESQLAECMGDESHSVYVGVDDASQVVGYVSVHWLAYLFLPGVEGFISELFVRPTARGHGLGAALLEVVKTEALERGSYRLSLLNGKHRESYEHGFYQKLGWEERPSMANFIYLMPED